MRPKSDTNQGAMDHAAVFLRSAFCVLRSEFPPFPPSASLRPCVELFCQPWAVRARNATQILLDRSRPREHDGRGDVAAPVVFAWRDAIRAGCHLLRNRRNLLRSQVFACAFSTGDPMFELTAAHWGWAICAALLLGTTKMGVAGLSMIAIPILGMVFGAKASTGVMLPLLICGDILAVSYYHRHADWKILARMLPIAMTGVVGGFFLLSVVTNQQLTFFMGSIILGLIVVTMLRDRGVISEKRIPTGIGFAVVMGLTAGVMTMMANAAGPVMAVYLLSMKLPKKRFIGTSSWFFIVLNVFKVPFSAKLDLITRESLLFDLKMFPCIFLGAVIGVLIVKRLSNKKYVLWVQIAAAAGALKLILS